jgi:16S rRNA pseudouridine516 synthase
LFSLADEISLIDIEDIEKGVTLKDGYKTAPCKVNLTDSKNGKITLIEGKYHEIKRIFASKGNKVTFLKRISFGGINLDENLNLGECRPLTKSEIELFTK